MELNLRRNSLYAVGEVVVSGLSLFLLYKKVVNTLGVEALGVWTLVLATTSLGRFADIGAASGLSRFVASAKAVALASSGMLALGSAMTMIMNCRAFHIRALPRGSELRSAVGETYGLLVR
jgi:O-antigen/teichoic acid export membrane protein